MDTKRGTPFEQSWRGPSRRSPCIIPDGNANSKDNSRPRRVKKRELERRCTDRKKRVFAPLDKTRISAYTVEYKRSAVKGRTRLFRHRREGGCTIACAARPPVPMEWSGGRPGAPPRRAAASAPPTSSGWARPPATAPILRCWAISASATISSTRPRPGPGSSSPKCWSCRRIGSG